MLVKFGTLFIRRSDVCSAEILGAVGEDMLRVEIKRSDGNRLARTLSKDEFDQFIQDINRGA